MAKGRNPIPAEIKEQLGNPSKRPIVKMERVQAELSGEIPYFLEDEDALAAWEFFYPMIKGFSFIHDENKRAIGAYCAAVVDWVDARRQLLKHGFAYKTKSAHMKGKMWRANPYHKIRLDLEKLVIVYEEKLGITPIDRQSLLNSMVGSGVNAPGIRSDEASTQNPDLMDPDDPMNFAFGSPAKPN